MPSSSLSERASDTASSEKSTPVALAPSLAHDIVSSPKWHCRWSRLLPSTSPTSSISMDWSEEAPALKPSTS